MAEKLKRTQPTSSIANALNLDAVRAATDPAPAPVRATPPPVEAPPRESPVFPQRTSVVAFPPQAASSLPQRPTASEPRAFPTREPTGEPPSAIRQIQLTPSTDATLERMLSAYSRATGLQLSRSEFLRAVLYALAPTVELHAREAGAIGPLKRPKNEAWLFHKRDELERAIARAFTAAMRAAPVMD